MNQMSVVFDDLSEGRLQFTKRISDSEETSGSIVWTGVLIRGEDADNVVVKIIPSEKPDEKDYHDGGSSEAHFLKLFSNLNQTSRNVLPFKAVFKQSLDQFESQMMWLMDDLDEYHPIRKAYQITLLVVELAKQTCHDYICQQMNDLADGKIRVEEFDRRLGCIIFQMLYTLHQIQQIDDSFRHNDLHLDNVLIVDSTTQVDYFLDTKCFRMSSDIPVALMYDFGLSSSKNYLNWECKGFSDCWGVAPFSDNGCPYDAHVFLNSFFSLLDTRTISQTSQTASFLRNTIPAVLRGKYASKAPEGRIPNKYQASDDCWKVIPSITDMLNSPYFAHLVV